MRKTLLTWCLAWLIAMLQNLELQALGRDNMALIGASNTVAQIDGTSPARTLMRPVMIPVPELAGMSLNDARAALLEANLRVGQVTSAESRSEPGSVLEQSPEAGAQVRPGSPVSLVIARRPLIPVPDLAGMSLNDARAALLEADLRVGQITTAESRSEPGSVLEQSPEAGARVRPGSPVSLVIARRQLIPVPDLAGMSLNDARAALLEADLRVGQITTAESGSEPGNVLEQSPEAGARVRPGSPVALAISARRTVEVPSVVGLELAEARDILERAGLVPVTGAANGQSDEALVVSQSPEPSETATEGTPVMLTLEAVAGTAGEQPPDQTPPWPAIATGATLIALLGGAILYRRSIRAKSAPAGREARVSIRETIDYGTQQVQLTGDPDKPPTIVLTIHPDQGIQEIRQP